MGYWHKHKNAYWKECIDKAFREKVYNNPERRKEWGRRISEKKKGVKRSYKVKTKMSNSRKKKFEKMKGKYYIINGDLIPAKSALCNPHIHIDEKKMKYATKSEVINWMANHLVDVIYGLELMKRGL